MDEQNKIGYVFLGIVLIMMMSMMYFGFSMFKETKQKIDNVSEKQQEMKNDFKDKEEPKDVIVAYPNFTNGDFELKDVQDFCKAHGIKLTYDYGEPDGLEITGKYPEKGKVFAMDKVAGDLVQEGDELHITIADY